MNYKNLLRLCFLIAAISLSGSCKKSNSPFLGDQQAFFSYSGDNIKIKALVSSMKMLNAKKQFTEAWETEGIPIWENTIALCPLSADKNTEFDLITPFKDAGGITKSYIIIHRYVDSSFASPKLVTYESGFVKPSNIRTKQKTGSLLRVFQTKGLVIPDEVKSYNEAALLQQAKKNKITSKTTNAKLSQSQIHTLTIDNQCGMHIDGFYIAQYGGCTDDEATNAVFNLVIDNLRNQLGANPSITAITNTPGTPGLDILGDGSFLLENMAYISGIVETTRPWITNACNITSLDIIDVRISTNCQPSTGDGSGGSGGGSGTGNPNNTLSDADLQSAVPVLDQNQPINPTKYINCFSDGKTARQYKLTIYVDQPAPGTSAVYSLNMSTQSNTYYSNTNNSFINVGHTFVGFEKDNTDGTSVVQVMGFYPGSVALSAPGVIKDNGGHSYNESYTVTVDENHFNAALSAVLYDSVMSNYTLSNGISSTGEYNCTDAAKNWFSTAGIGLPSAASGIFTNCPGAFGQTIMSVPGAVAVLGAIAPDSHGPCN